MITVKEPVEVFPRTFKNNTKLALVYMEFRVPLAPLLEKLRQNQPNAKL